MGEKEYNKIRPNKKNLNLVSTHKFLRGAEKSKLDTDRLKRVKEVIPRGIAMAMPTTALSDIREYIYYVNMIRTLDNARNNYVPQRKSHSITHFFAASGSKIINKNHWGNYFHKTLVFHKINGDHFSILKIPDVISFAKKFDRVVKYSLPLKNVKTRILSPGRLQNR
jgi:thioesterase domain-containing protein